MSAKILLLDIETAPILADVWRLFKTNVGINQIRKNGYIMSWAAKFLDEEYVYYMDCRENGEADEKVILKELLKMLNKADVIVGHNGDRFDLKWIRTRLLYHGFKPFVPAKQVDTLKIAKNMFYMHSNRLEFLANFLKCAPKKKHLKFPGHELWTECTLGNKEAWKEMEKYNIQDVLTLEEVYLKLRPWVRGGAPNLALYYEDDLVRCPRCGGTHLNKRGTVTTGVSVFQRYRCMDCGYWPRGRTNLLGKKKRKELLTNAT